MNRDYVIPATTPETVMVPGIRRIMSSERNKEKKQVKNDPLDLSVRFTDDKGNKIKTLVPTVVYNDLFDSHLKEKPGEGEYNYTIDNDSGYDYYKSKGIIRPFDITKRDIKRYSGVLPKDSKKYSVRGGLVNLDSVTADQLGDTPLSRAIADKHSQSVFKHRYDRLSPNEKAVVDNITRQTGRRPHFSTITLPEPEYWGWVDKGILKDGDVLYDDVHNPVFYKNGLPDMQMPTQFALAQTNAVNSNGELKPEAMNNPMLREYLNGNVPVMDVRFDKSLVDKFKTLFPFSADVFWPVMPEDQDNKFVNMPPNYPSLLPGVVLTNKLFSLDPSYSREAGLTRGSGFSWPGEPPKFYGNSKATADHEFIHTLNRGTKREYYPAAHAHKTRNEIIDYIDKSKDIPKWMRKPILHSILMHPSKQVKDFDRYNNYKGDAGAGFIDHDKDYGSTGRGEHTRVLGMNKRFVLKHLENVLPGYMEAKGLLKGMTDAQKLDAISDKAVEMANDSKVYRSIMRQFGLNDFNDRTDGLGYYREYKRPPFRFPDNLRGNIHPVEVHRALESFDKMLKSKNELRMYLPKDQQKLFDDDPDSYNLLYEKYLDKILPLIGNNSRNNVNPDGSVLA